jgi:hypothetical protein
MATKLAEELVSVIIVTRNRRAIVLECLGSVFKMNYPNFEVIVVDNASTDGTAEAIVQKYLRAKLIKARRNLGLNGGKNLGQKKARGKYILFLDSDTVVDKHLLTELVKVAQNDAQVGIVCPKMYYSDEKDVLWYAGASVNLWTSQTKNRGCNQKDSGQYDQLGETQFAPTAYLVSAKACRKLKKHDESLFMTYGDTDYGFRARKAGFKVMFCPFAKLRHRLGREENSQTLRSLGYNLPMRAYYFARNRVVFMKRHAPRLNFIFFLLICFPLATFYMVYKILLYRGGWRFLKPYLCGSLDGFKYALGGELKNLWR